MKIQILQDGFSKALSIASRFTSTRAQLPILGSILLTAKKNSLHISSTNLEISVSIKLGAKVEEEGRIGVPAKTITELITNLSKESLLLSSEKEQLKISSSSFSSNMLGMDSTDFPAVPSLLGKENVLVLSQKEIGEALSQTLFAVSVDETRPVLTGILVFLEKGELIFVATDGFRLSQKKIKIEDTKNSFKVILPKNILVELSRISEEFEEINLSLEEKNKEVLFGVGDTVLSSRLIEGDFPDYQKIIPKDTNITVLTDKEDLIRAVKLASVFARDAGNVVKLKVLKESIKISAESSQSGSQETEVEAKIDGHSPERPKGVEGEIAFNYKFLEEFLHSVKGEEIKMEFASGDKAGIFTDPKDPSYLHLIMPVKV